MKILILMAYYNRPQIVKNALESIKYQTYKNWELAFVDDGSDVEGKQIVEEILKDELDKVKFFNTGHSKEDKKRNGGSIFGSFWNKAMYESNADIGIMLCDDDALYPNSLELLAEYYMNNEETVYSYGHVSIFNPYDINTFDDLISLPSNTEWFLNKQGFIRPLNAVDASQVSWRIKNIKQNNITFPERQTISLDAVFYEQLYNAYGPCNFNGIIVQYKGIHLDQLGNRKNDPYTTKEMNDRII